MVSDIPPHPARLPNVIKLRKSKKVTGTVKASVTFIMGTSNENGSPIRAAEIILSFE